jgi:hypothetical protein
MPKVLMLVLASDGPVYNKFQECWRRYMNSNPDITCYFYKAKPDLEADFVFNGKNTLFVKCKESWDTCWEKTLMAFRYYLPLVDEYDFIYRTNLSSFIHFGRYLEYCSRLPISGVYSGFIGKHGSILYASGSGFTLSKDTFKKVVEMGVAQKKLIQDDVTIGAILNTYIVAAKRINWADIGLLDSSVEIFHVRLKSTDRNLDIKRFNQLIDRYYDVN